MVVQARGNEGEDHVSGSGKKGRDKEDIAKAVEVEWT